MKNLKISEETHTFLKTYCSQHKLKINTWANSLILLNFTYPVLLNILELDNDIEYLLRKLNSPETKVEEISKLEKQIDLLKKSKEIFIKIHLKNWNKV